ncbi:MAG: serine/threonine protein kinase [Thermoanaerobaculia bacterium]|nr:serine/threonine protein kinase [Thermoanaerobaculia bacterium]
MSQPQSIGRYRIVRLLGSGAMGDVYLAEDPNIGRELAVKTVRVVGGTPDDVADRKQRLLREARAAGKFVHPNVVTLFDADEVDGTLYLAFEYVPPGIDLAQRMTQGATTGQPLTLRQALRWVREIAQALQFAHEREIVHRDIKPSNVLIAEDGTAKVADFGIAKLLGPGTELTRTGSVVGSPQYMSPEQVRGEPLDGRSDVFSLGVVFYELLCGIRPFGGETLSTLVFEILSKEPPPVGSLRPSLPGDLVALAHRMLAKDRNHRCASATEVVEAIRTLETTTPSHMLDGSAAPSDVDETRRIATEISAQIDAQSAESPTVQSSARPASPHVLPPPPPGAAKTADATLAAPESVPPTPPVMPSAAPGPVASGPAAPPPTATAPAAPAISTGLPMHGGAAGQRSNTLRNVLLGLGVLAVLGVVAVVGLWFVVKSLSPASLPQALGGEEPVAESEGSEGQPPETASDDPDPEEAASEVAAAEPAEVSGTPEEIPEDEAAALDDLLEEVADAEREPPAVHDDPPPPSVVHDEVAPQDPPPPTEPVTRREPEPAPPPPAPVEPRATPPAQPSEPPSSEEEVPTPEPESNDRELQRWQAAANRADQEMSTGLHFRFDIKPKDLYVIVRVWPEGEGSIVKGATEAFKTGRKGRDMTLPGSGDHLLQLLINGEVQRSILIHASAAKAQTTTIALDFR